MSVTESEYNLGEFLTEALTFSRILGLVDEVDGV